MFLYNNKLYNNNVICDDDDNIDFNIEMLWFRNWKN